MLRKREHRAIRARCGDDRTGDSIGLRDSIDIRRGATAKGSANRNLSRLDFSSLSTKLAPYPLS